MKIPHIPLLNVWSGWAHTRNSKHKEPFGMDSDDILSKDHHHLGPKHGRNMLQEDSRMGGDWRLLRALTSPQCHLDSVPSPCKVFLTTVPMNSEKLFCNLICNPKVSYFDWSWALFLGSIPSLALTKRLSFASAADTATNCRRDVRTCICPLNLIGCLSWGSHPKKKCPVAWLLAFGAPR